MKAKYKKINKALSINSRTLRQAETYVSVIENW
jgi:hypothetical protein